MSRRNTSLYCSLSGSGPILVAQVEKATKRPSALMLPSSMSELPNPPPRAAALTSSTVTAWRS
jgi:hypothetical protein